MAAIPFTTSARLVLKMGGQRLVQYFDDDNDGVADPAAMEEVIEDANSDVESKLLGKGWTRERLEAAAALEDDVLSRIATNIAMGYAGERRPEWLDAEGKGPFDALREKAYERLKDLARARERLPAETEVGKHTQVGGRLSKEQNPDGHFIFASTAEQRARGSRGPGGF